MSFSNFRSLPLHAIDFNVKIMIRGQVFKKANEVCSCSSFGGPPWSSQWRYSFIMSCSNSWLAKHRSTIRLGNRVTETTWSQMDKWKPQRFNWPMKRCAKDCSWCVRLIWILVSINWEAGWRNDSNIRSSLTRSSAACWSTNSKRPLLSRIRIYLPSNWQSTCASKRASLSNRCGKDMPPLKVSSSIVWQAFFWYVKVSRLLVGLLPRRRDRSINDFDPIAGERRSNLWPRLVSCTYHVSSFALLASFQSAYQHNTPWQWVDLAMVHSKATRGN